MKITAKARIQNNAWRFDPDTGFLRCTASILCVGVMEYAREELLDADPPDTVGDVIKLYVSQEELEKQEGIDSLEGMQAVVGHIWQSAGNIIACGNVAGEPFVDGGHLYSDIIVTDPEAVRRIMLPDGNPDKLVEISSAGNWSIIWEPGVSPEGQAYDGYFVKLRYNHVALLPIGAGRAGATVRIINTKGVAKMDFTRMQYRGKTIRVANEDVDKMEEIQNDDAEAAKTAVTPEQLQAALDELASLKSDVEGKNARIAELEGQVQAFKDELDKALSDTSIEEAAAEMAEERDDATAVMNANGLQLDDASKKLRGHSLRLKVVNSIRVKNGKTELTKEQSEDQGFVRGMYSVQSDGVAAAKTVTGSTVVIQNQNNGQGQNDMSVGANRAARMYGQKK